MLHDFIVAIRCTLLRVSQRPRLDNILQRQSLARLHWMVVKKVRESGSGCHSEKIVMVGKRRAAVFILDDSAR